MAKPLNWPDKDPNEVLDYAISWVSRLAIDDKVISSSWEFSSGDSYELIITDEEFTDSSATIWLAGGVLKSRYVLTNRVVTEDGRTMDQSVAIKIAEK